MTILSWYAGKNLYPAVLHYTNRSCTCLKIAWCSFSGKCQFARWIFTLFLNIWCKTHLHGNIHFNQLSKSKQMQQEDEYLQPFVNVKRKKDLTIYSNSCQILLEFWKNSYDKQFTKTTYMAGYEKMDFKIWVTTRNWNTGTHIKWRKKWNMKI